MTEQDALKENYYLLGKRIELVETNDQYTKLTPGDFGTVNFIDDLGTVFVTWDNGSTLGLILGIDKWKIINV
jgi:hypothetical protein